jgi:sugar lactone lactonase YvrE
VRLTTAGATETVATLPANVGNPVTFAFSPDGRLHLGAPEAGTTRIRVFDGTGSLEPRPFSFAVRPDDVRVLGRMAADNENNLYLAVPNHHMVVRVSGQTQLGEEFAGKRDVTGWLDGNGPDARFNYPRSLALGVDGSFYVADEHNQSIRRVGRDREVVTVAGKPGDESYRNGRGRSARFNGPVSLAIDPRGNLFITDMLTRRIRRISPAGSVFLVAGDGEAGIRNGAGPQARFNSPRYLAIDGSGSLYVRDQASTATGSVSWIIRKLKPPAG